MTGFAFFERTFLDMNRYLQIGVPPTGLEMGGTVDEKSV